MKVFSKMKLKISVFLAIFCLNIFATIPWRHKMTIYLKYQLTNKLFKAVEDNNLEQVTYILDRYPEKINKIDSNHNTLLCNSLKLTDLSIANYLMRKEADPNILCANGETPLHYAIKNKLIEAIVFLVRNGKNINLNIKDSDNFTPLDYAYYSNPVANFLRENGAVNNSENLFPVIPIIDDVPEDSANRENRDLISTNNEQELEIYLTEAATLIGEDPISHLDALKRNLLKAKNDGRLNVTKQEVLNWLHTNISALRPIVSDKKLSFLDKEFRDLISENSSKPYPIIFSTVKEFKNHPITRGEIENTLNVIDSYNYWKNKEAHFSNIDFNNTLAEGDLISDEQFEISVSEALALINLQKPECDTKDFMHKHKMYIQGKELVKFINSCTK
jgi:hypothetical protein